MSLLYGFCGSPSTGEVTWGVTHMLGGRRGSISAEGELDSGLQRGDLVVKRSSEN